ncbi:MAG TPA: O-antigen ligase family protein [Solirubrobacteraceae bacterium]|nr:O-antigen ligase family protein [Solirubrobacteraceae bacterium]
MGQYVIYRSTGVLLFPKAQNLFFVRTGISNVFKATALGLDPNFLGMWMVPGFALGLVGLLRTKRRLLYGSLSLLCILGIMATGSRGALLSIVIGGATVGLIEASSAHRKVDARILRVTGLLIIAAVVAPFVVTVIAHAIARYPVTVNTRTEQVPIVLHDATSGNWTGKGYQAQLPQAASVGSPYVRQENVVHNTLLQALFEAGWLGFLVPLFMLLTGLTVALRLLHGAYDTESAMLGASFIVLAVNLQTLGAYAFRPFWFLWALLIAVGSIVMRSSTDTSSLSVSPKLSHYASQATSQAVLKRGHVLS